MVSCGTPHGVALVGFALPRRVPGRPGSHRVPTRPAWGPHRSVLRWGTLVGHPCGRWSSTRKTTRALPDPVQGGGEDPRPAQTNQPLPPAGALARAHGPDLGQGDVAAVGLDPNHPGAEGAAVRGSALALAPRQADRVPTRPASWGAPDPATVELARPRALPAPGGARPRCRWRRFPWRGPCEAGFAGTPWRSGATTPRRSFDPRARWPSPGSSAGRARRRTAAPSTHRSGLPTKPASWGTPLPVGVEIGVQGSDRPVGG